MKLSISNIAWEKEQDLDMYSFLRDNGIQGLEIAPTRIFPEQPYDKTKEAKKFQKKLYEEYGLVISSMQSIWYGRREQIFESEKSREELIDYTKRAFEFAHALNCKNLVFGCPKNRNINSEQDKETAFAFFGKLGELAIREDTVLAIEANPPIYNTNYLNTTEEVLELVQKLSLDGIKINYDFGTVLQNKEAVNAVSSMLPVINHVHISEPYLEQISFGSKHTELIGELKKGNYQNFISIEMKNLNNILTVQNLLLELKQLVGA